jgi:hypothetical protein
MNRTILKIVNGITQSLVEITSYNGLILVFAVHAALLAAFDSISFQLFLKRLLQSIGFIILARTIQVIFANRIHEPVQDNRDMELVLQTPLQILDFMVSQSSEESRALFTVVRDLAKTYYLTRESNPEMDFLEKISLPQIALVLYALSQDRLKNPSKNNLQLIDAARNENPVAIKLLLKYAGVCTQTKPRNLLAVLFFRRRYP